MSGRYWFCYNLAQWPSFSFSLIEYLHWQVIPAGGAAAPTGTQNGLPSVTFSVVGNVMAFDVVDDVVMVVLVVVAVSISTRSVTMVYEQPEQNFFSFQALY